MLISYGDNIVASVDPAVSDEVEKYLGRFQIEMCIRDRPKGMARTQILF